MRAFPWRLFFAAGALLAILAPRAALLVGADPPAGKSDFPAASPALAAPVKEMLTDGYILSPRSVPTAQAKLKAARSLAPNDPRLDYAFGLVLLKQGQTRPALAQFEAGTTRTGPAYWPAWQMSIWVHLVDKQYEKGLDRLLEFATIVRKSAPEAEATEPQREAVSWIGQILSAFVKTVLNKKDVTDLITRREMALRELLGPQLVTDLEAGYRLTDERDDELSEQADLAREVAREKQLKQDQNKLTKLESELKDLGKEKELTAKSKDDWKSWRDDQLKIIDKHLADLEKQYKDYELQAETLTQSSINLQRQMTLMDTQMSFAGTGITRSGPGAQMLMQRQRMDNQLLSMTYDYNAVAVQMNQTAELGRTAAQQREQIVDKYEKETGDLMKKTTSLDWTKRAVEGKKKKLEIKNDPGKAKAPKPPPEPGPPSLKTLMPVDLEIERLRVFESYAIKPDPAPAAPGAKKDAAKKDGAKK